MQGSFLQSFIKIGPMVSEKMSFEEIVDASRQMTYAGHQAITIAHLEHKVLR